MRVMHVVGNMDYGGVETLLMNIYRNIDRDRVQFDFLCHNFEEGKYDAEIRSLGGQIRRVPSIRASSLGAYRRALFATFQSAEAGHVVHAHLNAMNGLVLREAKAAGVPFRISHSHSANAKYTFARSALRMYSKAMLPGSATHAFACSEDAAEFVHNGRLHEKTVILKNAIDLSRFRYDEGLRERMREDLGLSTKFLLGHVGRFERQKNHTFLIDLFAEYSKVDASAHLLLAGTGSLLAKIENQIQSRGLEKRVSVLGPRNDVRDLMSAMDVFLFPSLFEGLGIVAIEAQAMGLPVLASDFVPNETALTSQIRYLPLKKRRLWLDTLISIRQEPARRSEDGVLQNALVKRAGYDVQDVARELQTFYSSLSPN